MKKNDCGSALFQLALISLAILSSSGKAFGDGCYFPEQAYAKPPAIPTQRALLAYRGGMEELIIESALDAEGQSFGWVIPLPTEPTELEKVEPGLFDVLFHITQPDITHDMKTYMFPAALIITAGFLFTFFFITRKSKLGIIFLILLLLLMFTEIMMPTLGAAGYKTRVFSPEVMVLQIARIGSYDVSVLAAKKPDALNDWLTKNGLTAIPENGRTMVEDYIAKGWVFVTAKLRREGTGLSVPHPLAMRFGTDKPVYPMRLTALSGAEVALELYTLSEKPLEHPQLTLGYRDDYHGPIEEGRWNDSWISYESSDEEFFRAIGHIELTKRMWDGVCLSKHSARLFPDDMVEDYYLTPSTTHNKADIYRPHFYSRQGAWQTALTFTLLVWGIGMPVLTLLARRRIEAAGKRSLWFKRVLGPMTAACLLLGGIIYLSLPKIDVYVDPRAKLGRLGAFGDNAIHHVWLKQFAEKQKHFSDYSIEEIRHIIEKALVDANKNESLSEYTINPWTGEIRRQGDGPGDYMILEDHRGVVFRTFDAQGFPEETTIKPKP